MNINSKHRLVIFAYKRVVECLSVKEDQAIHEAVVWIHIILEDLFKSENKRRSPFLYYDLSRDTENKITQILQGKTKDLKTSSLLVSMEYFLSGNNKYSSIRGEVELINKARNHLCHSIEETTLESAFMAEAISSVLKTLLSLLVKNYGPILVSGLKAEKERLNSQNNVFIDQILTQIKKTIQEKHIYYLTLSDEVVIHLTKQEPEITDRDIFISDTVRCPACTQMTFDGISVVDYDHEAGGVSGVDTQYHCRVCKLEMSDYEFFKVKEHPEISYILEGDPSWEDMSVKYSSM